MNCLRKRVESRSPDAAGKICARFERHCGSMLDIGGLLVSLKDVDDGSAVGDDKPFESPGIPQMFLEQHLVGARRELVDGVISTHHGLHMTFGHCCTEGWEVGLFKIARAWINIESVPQRLRPAVHRVVFARCYCAQMLQVASLNPPDEGNTHPPGQERIFSVGFLTASPTRI